MTEWLRLLEHGMFPDLPVDRRRLTLMAKSVESTVYGGYTSDGHPAVVKLTNNRTLFEQEKAVHALLQPHTFASTPPLLASGKGGNGGWLMFPDWRLDPIQWTPTRFAQAAAQLASVHRACTSTQPMFEGKSHTPPLDDVISQTGNGFPQSVRELAEAFGWKSATRERLQRFAATCLDRTEVGIDHALQAPSQVLCHGDPHFGNFLVEPSAGKLALVDWTFAHVDSRYFDLFQLLDATSPHTPLPRQRRHRAVLASYAEAWGQSPIDISHFQQGYVEFATLHLLWILTRIHADAATERFSAESLRRQAEETVYGLTSLARVSLTGKWRVKSL